MDNEPKTREAGTPRWSQRLRLWLILAASAFLVLLFYAEEDWRGWRAWNQFKRGWESKGERFNLASVVPPAVPDEQNFALTPIAFTSYGQVLTRDGKLIPEAQRDPNFVVRMRVPVTPVYPGPTNAAGDRVKGTFTRLDGWQSHYQELAAKTNAFPVPRQPGSPAADVLLALSRYDGVLDELRAANRLPHSRFPLNYTSESPFLIHLPHLAALKSCGQMLQLRSSAELQNDQANRAGEDVQLALQLAEKVRAEPLLISHLVRAAMVQLALQSLWEGLANHQWSAPQLAALDAELAKLDFVTDWQLSMRGELGAQADELERLRRHPDQLSEVQALIDYAGKKDAVHLPSITVARWIPAGWFYQTQYRCARMMEDYCLPLADLQRGVFAPALARRGALAMAAETNKVLSRFGQLIFPVLADAAPKFAYAQASADLARLAIALERCRLKQGELPESLEALVPRWIAHVPHDVIGGGPLRYRREAGGGFVLYSLGWNEKDDGGTPEFKDGSIDLQNGDWIWRYP